MNNISIKLIEDVNDPLLIQVEQLFQQMYEQIAQHLPDQALKIPLIRGGAELWLEGVKKMINRLGIVIVATRDNVVIGFINGIIHFTPDYLGDLKVGSIANIFVVSGTRRAGVGFYLVQELEQWFKSKNVHSISLQAIYENTPGIGFWQRCGYIEEVLQFRKIV